MANQRVSKSAKPKWVFVKNHAILHFISFAWRGSKANMRSLLTRWQKYFTILEQILNRLLLLNCPKDFCRLKHYCRSQKNMNTGGLLWVFLPQHSLKNICPSTWSCSNYRIFSIKRAGRLLNFWTLRVGAYSRWALNGGWALIKFSPFSASSEFLLQQNNK